MNSEGCRFAGPRESQRRAPFTSRPSPGASSRASSATPSTKSHGAARCHRRTGTWKASIPANMLATRNSVCRWRKYVELPPVNLLASAIAIEEEYTITMPNVSRRSAAHSTPLSYSASGARPGLMLRSIDHSFHRQAKHFSPMPVVTEHVEARAGGRKQHCIAGARRLRGQRHRLVHGCGASYRDACARDRRFDQRRVAADQHQSARRAIHGAPQRGKVLPLAVASGDENHLRVTLRQPGERSNRRANVGALGIVVPAHSAHL